MDKKTKTILIIATLGIAALIFLLRKSKTPKVIYDDWFLPSRDELYEMYLVLYLFGVGGFLIDNEYWNSYTNYYDQGNAITFTTGNSYHDPSETIHHVRACRFFTSLTNYNLRDIGPEVD